MESRTPYLFGQNPASFILFILLMFVAVSMFGFFSLTYGLTTMVGLILLALAFVIVLLNRLVPRGPTNIQPYIFLTCIALGVTFIFLSYLGVELGTVDLRFIPGLETVHNWIHSL